MVRKRDRYTRRRAKHGRPKTRAPTTGWLVAELAQLSATPIRTIRYYVEQRLLRPSEFRGTATRYQRRELLRLFVILRVRTETRLTLSEIKKRLEPLSEPELESWLRQRPLPPALATLLAAESTSAPGAATTTAMATAATAAAAAATAATAATAAAATTDADASKGTAEGPLLESWQRIPLAAGLELMVRADASPEVRRAAHRICAEYLEK